MLPSVVALLRIFLSHLNLRFELFGKQHLSAREDDASVGLNCLREPAAALGLLFLNFFADELLRARCDVAPHLPCVTHQRRRRYNHSAAPWAGQSQGNLHRSPGPKIQSRVCYAKHVTLSL